MDGMRERVAHIAPEGRGRATEAEMEKRVLIVDDEKDWVRMLGMRLGHAGYQVEAAFDAVQAVGQAVRTKPDLILLDIMMPAGGGLVALKNLKANPKVFTVPVIIVSAKGDKEARTAARELGAAGFFVKPVDMAELMSSMKLVLRECPSGAAGPNP